MQLSIIIYFCHQFLSIECSPSSLTPPEGLTTEEMDTENHNSSESVALAGRGIITQPQTVLLTISAWSYKFFMMSCSWRDYCCGYCFGVGGIHSGLLSTADCSASLYLE